MKPGDLARQLRNEHALAKAPSVAVSETTVVIVPEEVRNAASYRADGLVTELRTRLMVESGFIPSGERAINGGKAVLMTPLTGDAQKAQLANMDAITPPFPR